MKHKLNNFLYCWPEYFCYDEIQRGKQIWWVFYWSSLIVRNFIDYNNHELNLKSELFSYGPPKWFMRSVVYITEKAKWHWWWIIFYLRIEYVIWKRLIHNEMRASQNPSGYGHEISYLFFIGTGQYFIILENFFPSTFRWFYPPSKIFFLFPMVFNRKDAL